MKILLALILLLSSISLFAQSKGTLSKKDSLAIVEELKEDLKFMFGEKKESFGDVSAGIGSGFFRPTSAASTTTRLSKAVYNLSGSYYHKTGLGIDVRSLFLNDASKFTMFQTGISPSYTYSKNKHFAAGVNYTRYLYGDSLSVSRSPLVNEFQVFGRLKKLWLQPAFTFNYASGTYIENVPRQGSTPAFTITEKASDFGVMASVRHHFTLFDVLNKEDAFRITPSLMTVAGTSKYGMNFAMEGISKNVTRFNLNPKIKPKKKPVVGTTPPIIEEENYNSNFQMQSVTFVLGSEYSWKSFYIQPQYLVDYSFISAENKWTNVFNVSLGYTF